MSISAILVYLGVFEGLPARYWLVDGGAALLIALFAGAGFGLLTRRAVGVARRRWPARSPRSCWGSLLVSTLALTASYLSGVYGPVGKGGALILGLVAAHGAALPRRRPVGAACLARPATADRRTTAPRPPRPRGHDVSRRASRPSGSTSSCSRWHAWPCAGPCRSTTPHKAVVASVWKSG